MGKYSKLFIIITCFFGWGTSFAETIYVDDTLRLGVRPEPGNTTKPLAIVTSGTPLEVLSRERGYILIKTPDGTEGWVSGSYTTKETPPRNQLEKLQASHQELKEKHQNLLAELKKSTEQLKQAESHAIEAKKTVEKTTGISIKTQAWEVWGGVILVVAISFFLLGIRWHRNKIAQKLGGMQI